MKTNMKVLLGVLALAVIGASVYFSKNELQKGATRRPVGPQPDYIIESIRVDPENPISGQPFNVMVTVKNISPNVPATAPSRTSLYVRANRHAPAETAPLGPLQTEVETWQTTTTAGGQGANVIACADAKRNIAESNENKNCMTIMVNVVLPPPPPLCTEDQYNCESWTECSAEGSQTGSTCTANSGVSCTLPATATRSCTYVPPPPQPDFIIDSATAAQSTYSGSIYANVITIRNAGTAAANFTSSNSLRISGYLINSAGNRFGEVREVVIYSGGATTFTFQAGATLNVLSPYFYIPYHGDWSRTGVTGIRLTIDSSNSSNESNEINNTYDVTIPPEFLAWRPLPDLTVNQFTVNTTSPTAGNPVNFSARIANHPYNAIPGIVAGASTATLTINGTGTSAGLGEVYRQNVAIPELISGTTTGSITVNFEWPSASEGTYFAAICADSENVVVESDDAEWSNCTNVSERGYVTVAPAPSE